MPVGREFSALAVFALAAVGCETSSEDLNRARHELREAEVRADQTTKGARNEANDVSHETRRITFDDAVAGIGDLRQAEKENAEKPDRPHAEPIETNREGRPVLAEARRESAEEIAKVKQQAADEIAEAKERLDRSRKAAIRNAEVAVRKQEKAIMDAEEEVADAKAKVTVAEVRLRTATDDSRREMQKGLDDARSELADEQAELTESRHELTRTKMELQKVMAPPL